MDNWVAMIFFFHKLWNIALFLLWDLPPFSMADRATFYSIHLGHTAPRSATCHLKQWPYRTTECHMSPEAVAIPYHGVSHVTGSSGIPHHGVPHVTGSSGIPYHWVKHVTGSSGHTVPRCATCHRKQWHTVPRSATCHQEQWNVM